MTSLLHPGRRAVLGLVAASLALPRVALAQAGSAPAAGDDAPAPALLRLRGPLPNPAATDSAGRRRRLASEVIGGRVVAIDFVLTGCASLCSVVSAAMAGAQDLLAERLPREAGLLSISLDPFNDTPEELAAYAARFGAGPGWSFVSIAGPPLDEVLRRIGGPDAGGEHAPMVLVLDPLRGEVRRLLGLPSPERIARAVTDALAARRRTA